MQLWGPFHVTAIAAGPRAKAKTHIASRRARAAARAEPPGEKIAAALLDWYDSSRRDLPWRAGPGVVPDPYRVWLSEVMLQQTTVKAVVPFYHAFLRRWPTVEALAATPLDDVMAAWAGLGYYSRAQNLYRCAKAVVERHGGSFPATEAGLRELPGIGPYTAAAIAAIAFGEQATPVDGNVERVAARLFGIETPLPAAKPELKSLARTLTPGSRPGDHAQAMMDLGATVCTPKRPSCMICPLTRWCRAHAEGTAPLLPFRKAKPERPVRRGVAFLALREDGHILLRRRPDEGLLARMMEVPSSDWTEAWRGVEPALRTAPVKADWWAVPGSVVHTFTHFRLELLVYRAVVPAHASLTLWSDPERCRWVARADLRKEALPSVFRKVIGFGTEG
jgi:A/G-specific adenine glycosylase